MPSIQVVQSVAISSQTKLKKEQIKMSISLNKNGNKIGRRSIKHIENKSEKTTYLYSSHVREPKEGEKKSVYTVRFNDFLGPNEPIIFASVGGHRVYVYECTVDGAMELLQCYADPDKAEDFWTICWSHENLLAVAGKRAVIRVIDTNQKHCMHSFIGHTAPVNELKVNPMDPSLLLSASEDRSIRMWCITTRVCVAIFGGHEGHRDQVLCIDFNPFGNCFVSGGMDHSLRIWALTKPDIKRTIEESKECNAGYGGLSFPTYKVHAADFMTRDVHANYVDSVLWFGDFILSKACGSGVQIKCWQPQLSNENRSSVNIFHEFNVDDCQFWFMRFNLNYDKSMMAIGDPHGKIILWNLDNPHPKSIKKITLSHPHCEVLMRQPAFSRNGDVLICGDDNGTIWRWDKSKL